MTLFGADVSQVVNEGLVQQSGCTYLLARAIMETRAVDPNFTLTARSARAAGMIPGGYHWLMPSGGADQAAQFLKLVSPFMDRTQGFVVWLDCEASSKDPNTGKAYHPDPTWDDAAAFIAAFRSVSDWPIGLYGNAPFLRSLGIPPGALAAIPNLYLVLAAYPVRYVTVTSAAQHYPGDADPDWSVAIDGLAPRMWQFIGSTADESQSVDLSAFRGDMAALRKIAGVTDMDVSTLKAPAFVDVRAGGSLYAELASRTMLASPWAGGTNIGTIGTARRADNVLMRALIVDDPRVSGTNLIVGWTGDDHCTLVGSGIYSQDQLDVARSDAATAQKQADIAAATAAATAAIKAI